MESHRQIIYDLNVATAKERILLVDDEPQLIAIMKRYLERLGYEVIATSGTAAAWEKIEKDPAALALAVVDMTMPGMSGEELARRILAAHPTIRVIAASGYPVDVKALESIAAARFVFLHKPFTPEMLADAIKRLLETS